ncbi:MAG: heparinase II/III family protein [Tannerella sp.]|jgi:hypothetical protein|nr:heparinase II/III family protein [Tannerella sp.]
MITRKIFVAVLIVFCFALGLFAVPEYVNESMKIPSHPRLLLLKGEENALLKKINKDLYWKDVHECVLEEATRIVGLPVNGRILTGRRLLSVSRENLRRIFILSYACRMTGQKKYAERAEQEMLAAAGFSDWNPSHFLDVGEMTMALAIGYDWLYDKLPRSSREKIREAIYEKGIQPSYNESDAWFLKAEHNWNQVCNAGIAYGALAIYEDHTSEAVKLLNRSLESIRLAMKEYGPDGAYPEGIGYWDYGTSFNVMFIAAVEKVYKTDFGMNETEGFMETGMYSQAMITPSFHTFSYADNGPNASFNPTVCWFYSKTQNPALFYLQKGLYERDSSKRFVRDRLIPVSLIFGAGSGTSLRDVAEPTKLVWAGQGPSPVITMRSSWSDPSASFLGFKLGSPSVNHAHMDVGSFIFEAEGIRWAFDFGAENYHRLESRGVNLWDRSQDSQRWDVFRYRTESHNTLCFNDKPQSVSAAARIDDVIETEKKMSAMSDLSAIYKAQILGVKRAVSLVDKKYVVIQDQLNVGSQFTKVRWNMLTEADKITFTSINTAILEKDGKKLQMKVEAPVPIRFYRKDTTPVNTCDSPNEGSQFVGFEADLELNKVQQITVWLMPGETVPDTVVPYSF